MEALGNACVAGVCELARARVVRERVGQVLLSCRARGILVAVGHRELDMTLKPYTGNSPMRVSRDAKYTVTAGGAIRLEYQESRRVRYLLTTEDHAALAHLVNEIKRQLPGR